jgi:hypothetical protein
MRCALFLAMLFAALGAGAQRSPFTGIAVPPADSTGAYRLMFGGHFHGSSTGRSGFPAATVLAGIDTINTLAPHMLLSTGDLFLSADKDSARFARAFFHKLRVPLFNAVGNHDVEGEMYLRSYGPTHQVIDIGDDRVIILDTERDNGDVRNDQLATLRAQAEGPAVKRLFIVSHRPVWAEEDERYGPLFEGNTRSALGNNFRKEVLPVLQRIAERSEIFWVSGSMAGGAPASIFFQEDAPNITYIQCAIRDEPRDALLIADVTPTAISWRALSLTGQQLEDPRMYDAAFWRSQRGGEEGFNWRLVPLYVGNALGHRAFWYGAGAMLLLVLLLRRVLRRGL